MILSVRSTSGARGKRLVESERAYSVRQLADRWGCSGGLIYKLIRQGTLHAFRPGNPLRISAAEVRRFESGGNDWARANRDNYEPLSS